MVLFSLVGTCTGGLWEFNLEVLDGENYNLLHKCVKDWDFGWRWHLKVDELCHQRGQFLRKPPRLIGISIQCLTCHLLIFPIHLGYEFQSLTQLWRGWDKLSSWRQYLHPINDNFHGHSQSVQLYATSAIISRTKFGSETHNASPINVVTQVFHYLSTWGRHPRGRRLFWLSHFGADSQSKHAYRGVYS